MSEQSKMSWVPAVPGADCSQKEQEDSFLSSYIGLPWKWYRSPYPEFKGVEIEAHPGGTEDRWYLRGKK